ncbi:MAG: hypothetical protein LC802_07825 [Acidobacteria bacterium]|nr:hypothetical protein [Acidobacteriota bacterium]
MSINSLTEAEVRRSLAERAAAAGVAPPVGAAEPDGNAVSNALSMLVKYIPTESITLYVAALSAVTALKSLWEWITALHIYWFFGLFTPILFVLIFLGKRRAAGLPTIPPLGEWPWWKTFAATVGFLVWALAVPGNPYVNGDTGGAVVGFLAIFISTVLSVLEPLFDRRPSPAP